MGAQTQHKARPQVGHPNATQGTSASWVPQRTQRKARKRRAGGWIRTNFGLEVDFLIRPHQGWAPQRNARHVRKMGAQTQHKACPQVGRPNGKARPQVGCLNARPQRKARLRPQVGRPNATQGASARTSATQGTSASWAAQRTSATQTQGTSAIWAPQRNARHVRKMVAQTQNSYATKTSTQGSTRLKDELEDG
jgi:hypothetical protein